MGVFWPGVEKLFEEALVMPERTFARSGQDNGV